MIPKQQIKIQEAAKGTQIILLIELENLEYIFRRKKRFKRRWRPGYETGRPPVAISQQPRQGELPRQMPKSQACRTIDPQADAGWCIGDGLMSH
ncbi:hypothetical protein BOW51_07160 [Solemya velesiana gill symbiont]|uniref:Uncharacterized protein n=1 Tax=Solemya velesiana gill symbiont TaxID=1918948 RepID=A0A1T2KUE3_9GAMM|nr:hypothetical protein BOW51_07160 [Solemya velesiana gill symbiont]